MKLLRLLIWAHVLTVSIPTNSQDSTASNTPKISSQYFESISKKANTLRQSLDKKSHRILARMQKQEAKLQKKLAKIDSFAANNVFKDAENKYKQLQNRITESRSFSQYIPRLDTIVTSFKFLEQNQEWLTSVKDAKEKLDDASSKLKELQSKLQGAEDLKKFLKERKEYLKQQLEKFGFAKDLKKINKDVYYFSQQVNEYKEILKDTKKAERKAIELLSKTKLFKDFMKKNSLLASLFRIPGDQNGPTNSVNLAGLQTRVQVNSLIQSQLAAGGLNSQQAFQQNLQQAQLQLSQLKDRVNKLGDGDAELLDFKPNNQKTKSFLQRLEFGTNIQSQGKNGFLPVTSDLGLSVGYRINDKSVLGIGASYKIGWGHGWNNIRLSNQGAGIRSFLDWKLKGSFFVSGGYEMNYRPTLNGLVIQSRAGVLNAEQWQQSGLLGISKVISIKSKLFNKTKAQLLWDFMAQSQMPKTQSIIFRINYSFK